MIPDFSIPEDAQFYWDFEWVGPRRWRAVLLPCGPMTWGSSPNPERPELARAWISTSAVFQVAP